MLQLMMVGTGSAFAKNYLNNSALLSTKDYTLLIDCGATTLLGLHRLGADAIGKIDGVLITHIHGDHINGLEGLAFQMMYKYKKKPDLILPAPLYFDIWNHSLKGGLEKTAEGNKTLEDYFNVKIISERLGIIAISGMSIELIPTQHIPHKLSYGFLINQKLWYSGDAIFDPDLIRLMAHRADVIFHDCQLHHYEGQVHASFQEICMLDDWIREKMYLMHYGDDMDDFKASAKEHSLVFAKEHELYEFHI